MSGTVELAAHPATAAGRAERLEKLIGLCALGFAIELVLFKFLPDLGTAQVQHSRSALTDFGEFEREYLIPGSVHHARFLGNLILYHFAKLLTAIFHSTDLRLHPLRVAAGILTPLYAYLGAYFPLDGNSRLNWRYFLSLYGLVVVLGLYVFYPADAPSLAFLSMALFFLLKERLGLVFLLMLVTGLFRETAFHIVWFVALWALCSRSRGRAERLLWVGGFAAAFALEYVTVRRLFPGPISSAGGVIFDPRALFLDRGLLSLTTICSLGLAALFPLACALRITVLSPEDWRRRFFELNCYAFPAWIVFYRMMAGNLSEFRMLYPVVLPCIFGIAYAATPSWPRNAFQSGT